MARTPAIVYQLEVLQDVCGLLEKKPKDDPIIFTATDVRVHLRKGSSMKGMYEKKCTLTTLVCTGDFQMVSASVNRGLTLSVSREKLTQIKSQLAPFEVLKSFR